MIKKVKLLELLLSSGWDSIKLIKSEYIFNSSGISFAPLVNISFLLCDIIINLFGSSYQDSDSFFLSYFDKTPSKLTTSLSLTLHPSYNIDNI